MSDLTATIAVARERCPPTNLIILHRDFSFPGLEHETHATTCWCRPLVFPPDYLLPDSELAEELLNDTVH